MKGNSNEPMSGGAAAVRAQAARPSPTKGKVNTGNAGSERPVSPQVVQSGGSAAEAAGTRGSLATAVGHLHSEHPIAHDDRGPHHGGTDHVRHAQAVKPNTGHPYGRG